jgi:hypothetical protein
MENFLTRHHRRQKTIVAARSVFFIKPPVVSAGRAKSIPSFGARWYMR